MSGLVLIGQAPSRKGNPRKPLSGNPAKKLANLAGICVDDLLLGTERFNLIKRFPGKAGKKGDLFPRTLAKRGAMKLLAYLAGKKVVFLGGGVSRAFGLDNMDACEWIDVDVRGTRFVAAKMPHPSGVNRWWNEKANEDLARAFMVRLAGDMGWITKPKAKIKTRRCLETSGNLIQR